MWLEGGVGASEATDLADWKPGADRMGGGAYTVCYVTVLPFSFYKHSICTLKIYIFFISFYTNIF
jgi:hypothetical protein